MPKTKSKCTQLQARTEGSRMPIRLTIDDPAQMNMDFIKDFCRKSLNINPSTSLLLRKALSVYVSHIQREVARLHAMESTEDAIMGLAEFIQCERDEYFLLAGFPERTYDRKYNVE